jgi:class I fructose-bisphosphate aldolase
LSKVNKILDNYKHVSPGVRSKIYTIANTGNLKGTGKFVIYPVDQGFEHGPGRSFSKNPAGYDPLYHVEFAIEAGTNAYAAPLGFIQQAAAEYPGHIPYILKVNNNDSLFKTPNPSSAITSTLEDALDLGCSAVGFTIYPGTSEKNIIFEQLKEFTAEAHRVGLAVVVWSYPRGENISKEGETALDIVAYAAQIAAQMGADIIKVKPPTAKIELEAAKSSYEGIKKDSLSERVSHVIDSAFTGRRIVIFSGGAAKDKESVIQEIKELKQGGAFGSIIGSTPCAC